MLPVPLSVHKENNSGYLPFDLPDAGPSHGPQVRNSPKKSNVTTPDVFFWSCVLLCVCQKYVRYSFDIFYLQPNMNVPIEVFLLHETHNKRKWCIDVLLQTHVCHSHLILFFFQYLLLLIYLIFFCGKKYYQHNINSGFTRFMMFLWWFKS